jgi:hypothetical protein
MTPSLSLRAVTLSGRPVSALKQRIDQVRQPGFIARRVRVDVKTVEHHAGHD